MTPVLHRFAARDGIPLAWRELGEGPPVILLHGLFSNATMNWIKYGHAARIAEAGFRAIMLDFRAHGDSGAPHDAGHYPPDVLIDDVSDLIDHLAVDSYDLAGFSLGARTAARGVVNGLRPQRLVLGGMGLGGLAGWLSRSQFFQRVIAEYDTARRGDDTWMAVQFMKTMNVDRIAAGHLLASFTDTDLALLARVTMPTLVVCGAQDQDNGSGPDLAAALPDGRFAEVPGTHMSSVTETALGQAYADFLSA
ncbi:MAG: alpha/beta hydrolase [Sphingopyxis sp.]|nr:alpha/beta hydrolase [Sphingopyxis sp.]